MSGKGMTHILTPSLSELVNPDSCSVLHCWAHWATLGKWLNFSEYPRRKIPALWNYYRLKR